ncbi:MAG: hypothetical protein WCI76_00125 [bacterium]
MKKIIHHLRSKPEHIRRHILHVLTVVAGFILLSIWFFSLSVHFSDPDTQVKLAHDVKPFSALKDNLVGGYQSLSAPNASTESDLKAQVDNL